MPREKRPALAATSRPGASLSKSNARQTSIKPKAVPLDDVLVEGREWPLLPEREYLVAFTHHETAMVFRTPKVFLHFRIVELGQYLNQRVFSAYRATELIGRHGKHGRFKLKRRTELYLAMCWLYQARNLRPDRVSLRHLKGLVLRAKVRTVTVGYRQRPLPDDLHYSVVDTISGIEAGDIF